MPPPPSSRPFAPNLARRGRIIRGISGGTLLAGAAVAWQFSVTLAIVLLASGLFLVFEALRGWCVLRACRIQTRF